MISGLTVDEASYRLRSEESLDGFIVGVTAMPIDGNTRNNLELFGVNLFNNQTSSQSDYFSTQSLPDLYQIGVGDRVLVQLYGSQNRSEILTVNNEGAINIFGIGPIHIIGVSNQNLNSYIDGQISGLMVGTEVNATVVSSRPIEVFIIGAVNSPGSILVGAFSTLTDALIAAEGIVNQASLRNIVVIRNGEEINIDLYDFIISGDSSADPRLLQGDTILVNLADTLVGVSGQVRRESIYEVVPGTTSADLIEMAGGVNGIADINSSVIERLGGNGVAQSIALSMISEGGFQDGDFIRIPTISSTLADSITIVGGHVSEGINPWREGDRLLDVIGPRESLTANVDMSYILIRRQPLVSGDIEYLMANLSIAFDDPDSSDNLFLEDRDTIYLFTASVRRSSIINPLVTELRYISSINTSSTDIDNVVSMFGHVYFPSEYPLTNMMTLSDLIAASGGTRDGADLLSFSVLRMRNEGSIQNQEIISIDAYQNTEYRLMAGDIVSVLPLSNWDTPKSIELLGEVQRPGMYMITAGESLGNVIDRAGGFTQEAFLSGLFYQREVLMEREISTKELLLLQIQAQPKIY
jgi:polysaccharide export outer membrane protein